MEALKVNGFNDMTNEEIQDVDGGSLLGIAWGVVKTVTTVYTAYEMYKKYSKR